MSGVDPASPSPASDHTDARPYDALVLLSFGGPEAPEDVVPFLQNVTRGRGIPPERLEQVGEHYYARGGRSPINDQNRALLTALREELARRGVDLPVHWGNRNWRPYLTPVLREAHRAGARRVLVLATSAYSSYSGCRQYREDVAAALLELAAEGRTMHADKVRHFHNHPGFVAANADAVAAALHRLGDAPGTRLVLVTHSVPTAMAASAGPHGDGYVRQHEALGQALSAELARRGHGEVPWDLVYCSRSGPPSQPWLEPDVNDHLTRLAAEGVPGVVLAPVGFVSDHMEVVHDLDTEAAQTAAELGLPTVRAATAGVDAHFVAGLVDLVLERAAAERGVRPPRPAVPPLPASHDVCPAGCCPNLRAPDRPAACGEDWQDPRPTTVSV